MRILTGFRVHASLAGLALALVVPMRAALKEHYARQRQELQRQAVNERRLELATHWNSFAFTTTGGRILPELVLMKIDWPSLQLAEPQETRLKNRLREVFDFLGKPRFEEYYRLKTEAVSGRLEFSSLAANALARIQGRTNASERQEPIQALQSLWNSIYSAKSEGTSARITGISSDHIRAEISRTNSYDAIFKSKVGIGLTAISEALEPGFRYGSQTNAVSSDSAEGLFFHLSFFARSSASTNAGPVYLSLYWSEPDQSWALSRLFADRLLNFQTMF